MSQIYLHSGNNVQQDWDSGGKWGGGGGGKCYTKSAEFIVERQLGEEKDLLAWGWA